MATATYLGVDFSGGSVAWRARCARPTVWIATLEEDGGRPRLADLRPVQALPGAGEPFARLAALLEEGRFAAAGIDAPFSLPAEHLPPGGHRALLAAVADLPAAPDRPFPRGAALVALAASVHPLAGPKPLRATERRWRDCGVNVRSTLWNGPRGGAPFAAACLALLARAGRPVWPWAAGAGMLAEAFPAAQLRMWALPHVGYGRPGQRAARAAIVAGLRGRVSLPPDAVATMLEVPDALDAVVAAFGAIAAARRGRPAPIPADGLIAVLDGDAAV